MHIKIRNYSYYMEWRIQRPDRYNGLGLTIGQELIKNLRELKQQCRSSLNHPRMLAITAEAVSARDGRSIWIAGGDLKELALFDKQDVERYARTYHQIIESMQELPIPIVALIDGEVIGGGVEMILGADIRVATKSSSFIFKQTSIGLTCGFGGTTLLRQLVGDSRARAWLLTNKQISAQEAESHGLIHEVTETSPQLERKANSYATHFSKQDPKVIANMKKALSLGGQNQKHTLEHELKLFVETWGMISIKAF